MPHRRSKPFPRIALIHATALSMEPVGEAFARHWPHAQCMNLLDDTLSVDRARTGLTPAITQRFVDLASYSVRTGCSGILFTCSAFGPAIEEAARTSGVPTHKPNEAMFRAALDLCEGAVGKLGLVATFEPSIESMGAELLAMAARRGIAVELQAVFVDEAMPDLAQGRADDHHRKVTHAARQLAGCNAVMLAQFSMAAAQPLVQRELECPVLASPDCAVLMLKEAMQEGQP